ARQGHAELALAAPAFVDLPVARWREAGIGLELGVGGRWCEQGGQEEGGEAWGHALGLWERGGGPAIVASRSRGAYLSIGTMRAMQGNNPVTGELSNSKVAAVFASRAAARAAAGKAAAALALGSAQVQVIVPGDAHIDRKL